MATAVRTPARDADVAYIDPTDLAKESELAWEGRLRTLRPDVPWEVENQAAVHLWYEHANHPAAWRQPVCQALVALR